MSESAPQQPLRIFVVEDHPDTLGALTLMATQMGFEVHTASRIDQALQAFATTEFDVLLSDIGLPDGDGWQLLQRAHFRKPVYAIAMSGYGGESDILKSKAAGFAAHITKPFKFPDFKRTLEQAVQARTQDTPQA